MLALELDAGFLAEALALGLELDDLDATAFLPLDDERDVLADALGLTDRRLGATWRTLRTGRFQSTALSARNLAGIAIGPSA